MGKAGPFPYRIGGILYGQEEKRIPSPKKKTNSTHEGPVWVREKDS